MHHCVSIPLLFLSLRLDCVWNHKWSDFSLVIRLAEAKPRDNGRITALWLPSRETRERPDPLLRIAPYTLLFMFCPHHSNRRRISIRLELLSPFDNHTLIQNYVALTSLLSMRCFCSVLVFQLDFFMEIHWSWILNEHPSFILQVFSLVSIFTPPEFHDSIINLTNELISKTLTSELCGHLLLSICVH